ncbi:MAG: hypothetical protein LAN61_07000 [Acidobacteriia bacterium]|nr:hypothetical protein [Terriglobia bacterium]
MRGRNIAWVMVIGLLVAMAGAAVAWASQQGASSSTVPVTFVVSVEANQGKDVPTIHREDIRAFQGRDRLQVTEWVPLQGEHAELELYVLLDDGSDPVIGLQFDDLRQFMNAQPASTAIAVGYMRYGTVNIVQKFTKDHAQAGKALRLPMGVSGISASPYLSISDLIKGWPESPARREIFMISSGIDPLQPGPNDTYLAEAINRAQRAGIQIYTIYASSAGHFGHSFWRINWGQNNLSQLADETGGEAYFQGFQTPISFTPFLEQFADRLKHQYRLTVLAKPGEKAGYQRIRLETEVPNAALVAADRVYVPAAK